MEVFFAQLLNGLSLGSIYVLLVTGFNLLLLVARVIHFSYPQMVVFSMYISWIVLRFTGNNVPIAVVAGVGASIFLNILIAPLFLHVMRNRKRVDINTSLVISLGIGMIITDILSHQFNKGFPIAFPEKLVGTGGVLQSGLIAVSRGQFFSLVGGVVVVALFFRILYKTRPGRAFRAVAEDPDGAQLVGIPLIKTGLAGYALTGLLGGITGVLLAMLLGSASPGLGEQVALKVLAVSIIAGLGNLRGGLIVGFSLGVVEAMVQGYIAGSWSNAIAFLILLGVILVRPRGLFGMKL